MQKTIKPNEIQRSWFVADASQHTLGHLATKVASLLMGKNRSYYSPQWDMGDHVIIINAEKIKVTGKKDDRKLYFWHTGWPGGLRSEKLGSLRARKPEEILKRAVTGMLPKTKLAKDMIQKLHVYRGEAHPFAGQNPTTLVIKN